MPEEYMRLLALWALVHELADDTLKAAVARGQAEGADAADTLAALVAEEKDRLRAAIEAGDVTKLAGAQGADLDEVRFEMGELRGRLESIETTLDAIARRLEAD